MSKQYTFEGNYVKTIPNEVTSLLVGTRDRVTKSDESGDLVDIDPRTKAVILTKLDEAIGLSVFLYNEKT